MKTYSFEKLEVWQRARKLAVQTYQLTGQFPYTERFGICRQMQRAAISVCSNLAEGNSKFSAKEKARFTETSYCSLMELLNQCIISFDLGYLDQQDLDRMRSSIDLVSGLLSRLRTSQIHQ